MAPRPERRLPLFLLVVGPWLLAPGHFSGCVGRSFVGRLISAQAPTSGIPRSAGQAAAHGATPLDAAEPRDGPSERAPDARGDPIRSALCVLGAAALAVLMLGRPMAALAESVPMAAVAPCLLSKCQLPLAKCVLNPFCAANLTCIIGCTGQPDEKSCQIKCGDQFENDVVTEFNACALSSKKCVPQRPDEGPLPGESKWDPVKGRYPIPPEDSISKDFEVAKMSGRWYISAGLNPLFDTFPCQVHFFEGFAPKWNEQGKLVGKINWRISEPDGEFLTKSTVQVFKQVQPGVLENHGNEYLHYQDDWFVLDHGFEDDPELGFVLIYYRGTNDAWAGYGGGTLYTRSPEVNRDILERVSEACEKAQVPFYKFWKLNDNTCPKEEDPIKLRKQYAERLLQQTELSVEEQLTYMARTAYSEVDKDERYVVNAVKSIEAKTETFVKDEINLLAKAEKEVEKDLLLVEKEVEKDLLLVEKELEKDEQLLEAPFKKIFQSLFPASR